MKTADALNFFKKLNTQKVYNAGSVLGSYYLSRVSGRPVQWGRPFNVSIEPTTQCNLGCTECPSGLKSFTRPTGYMDYNFYVKTIDELGKELIYLYFYFQGEPYLHPRFTELVKYAAAKNIYTVTSTNGHFLTERRALETVQCGLDRIIISVDGTTQETYEKYRRGGELEKVLQGARNLVVAKRQLKSKTPHIIFQFLVMRHNEHQVHDFRQLALQTGADEVKLKSAQVYDYKNGSELLPALKEYSRYEKTSGGEYRIKNSLLNHCWKLWHSCVITWDGRIVPCCFDKDAQHQLGDLNNSAFMDIWQGKLYRGFRKRILQSRAEIDICTNCSEGTKVWL